jgi:RNA polymerase-binding transcription factor DksA
MAVDTNRFRQALLDERERVAKAIDYLHEENPGSLEDESGEVVGTLDNHMGDVATVTYDRELDYSLEENSETVLREIDAALQRIEAGTYGVCEVCGRPIEEERLESIPWTRLCLDDARKQASR